MGATAIRGYTTLAAVLMLVGAGCGQVSDGKAGGVSPTETTVVVVNLDEEGPLRSADPSAVTSSLGQRPT